MNFRVRLWRVILTAITASVAACSAAARPMESPAINLSGIWQGEIRVIPCFPGVPSEVGRCNAVNRITLSLRQSGSTVTGDYRCAIGTMVCRDANTTERGTVVDGWVSGSNVSLRIMLPGDVSSCLFNGSDSASEIRGSYRCYQGGGLAEMGLWRVRRGSGEQPVAPWRPE